MKSGVGEAVMRPGGVGLAPGLTLAVGLPDGIGIPHPVREMVDGVFQDLRQLIVVQRGQAIHQPFAPEQGPDLPTAPEGVLGETLFAEVDRGLPEIRHPVRRPGLPEVRRSGKVARDHQQVRLDVVLQTLLPLFGLEDLPGQIHLQRLHPGPAVIVAVERKPGAVVHQHQPRQVVLQ